MAQTGGPNRYRPNKPRKARKVRRAPIGPPAPKRTAGPAGAIGPKRVVRRAAGPAGPVGRPKAPAKPTVIRRSAGPAGPVGKQETNPVKIRRKAQRQLKALKANPVEHEHYAGVGPLKVYTHSTYTDRITGKDVTGQRNAKFKAARQASLSPTDLKIQKFVAKKVTSPAVKVLNTATIPSHAIAGVAAGKSPAYGVRHHTTFSSVLKKHGVGGPVGAVGGFVADVATDPLTYVTAGVGSVGAKAAEKAGRAATQAAIKEGASKKAADRAGRAAAGAAVKAKGGRGVQVGAKFHVPFTDKGVHFQTSGRGSAAVGRKLRPVTRPARDSQFVQAVGRGFVHDFRPAERTVSQHRVIREAEREHRGRTAAARKRVIRKTHALGKAVPKAEDQRRVIDAIESNDLSGLAGHEVKAAQAVRHELDKAHALTYTRGIGTEKFKPQGPEDAAAYLPHYRQKDLDPNAKKAASHGGTTRVSAAKGRTIRKPLSTTREEMPDLFSENLPRVTGVKLAKEHERASLHDFWQKVASTGRPLHRRATINRDEEMVYRVDPDGLTALAKDAGERIDQDAVNVALKDTGRKYVILNKRTVEDVKGRLGNRPSSDEILNLYDKAQGRLKLLYTVPNPSYHARNLLGDSLNAFLGDASAKSFHDAYKTLRAQAGRNKLERTSLDNEHAAALGAEINLGKAGKTTLGQELAHAENHGAIGGGFIGRELPDLVGKQGALSRAAQYREDFPRLATYLSARKRGMTPSQAAEWSLKHHFDYADLTNFERTVARRVVPFWTFFARNTRLHATKVLTRPGKIATFGKVLEETSKAAGFNSYEEYAGGLKDYQQRGLPIPVKFNGKVYSVQVGPPATDLNQITTNPQALGQDIINRVTFFKTAVELVPKEGYSFFFQQPIQPEGDELTDAPALVAQLPAPIKKLYGVTKVGGKWQWKRKADYAMRSLPEGNLALSALGASNPLRQQTRGQTIAGVLTGAKITTTGTPRQQYSQLSQALHEGQVKAERMRNRRQALNPDNTAKPAYRRQLDINKALQDQKDALGKKLGVEKNPTMKRVKKGRPRSGGFGGGGFGEGYGGGGYDG